MAATKEYFQEYYRKNRVRKLAEGAVYHKANKAVRNAYNRKYYEANKHKWPRRSAEKQAEHNRVRRERYKTDEVYRNEVKSKVKEWVNADPRRKKRQRLRKYGLTIEQFDAMRDGQRHVCAICGLKPNRFHVDHCHTRGQVRGLLCNNCNLGLGKFRDSIETLERAILYLRPHIGSALAH